MNWKAAVGLIAGGVLLGSIASVAAQSPAPSPDGSAAPKQMRPFMGGHHAMGPGRGAIRSESVIKDADGKFVTVRMDAGELKAVDGKTITVNEEDGKVLTVDVPDDARIGRDGQAAKVTDLKAGDHVSVMREKSGEDFVVKAVKAISAERWTQMQEQGFPGKGMRGGFRGPGGPGFRGPGAVPGAPAVPETPQTSPAEA